MNHMLCYICNYFKFVLDVFFRSKRGAGEDADGER